MSNSKIFRYSITDPPQLNDILIDIDKYQTVLDLKKQIAINENISYSQLIFLTPQKETKLKNIEEHHKFYLKTIESSAYLRFQLQNGKRIEIERRNNEIFESFQQEGFYFSDYCIKKNVHFIQTEDEMTGEIYEKLEIFGNVVTLKYDEFQFILSENEYASEAYQLTRKAFRDSESISIRDSHKNKLNYLNRLKMNEIYTIYAEYKIMFKSNDEIFSTQYMDYFSTVSDAKNRLVGLFDSLKKKVNPDEIVIYDRSQRKLFENEKKLVNIQSLNETFYFSIEKTKKESQKSSSKLKQTQLKNDSKSSDVDLKQDLLDKPKGNYRTKQQSIQTSQKEFKKPLRKDKQTNNEDFSKLQKKISESSFSISSFDDLNLLPPNAASNETSDSRISKTKSDQSIFSENESRKSNQQPKLPIIFFYEKTNEMEFYPILKEVPLDATVDEIQKMIAYEYLLPEDYFVIKYKEDEIKVSIDPQSTLNEILDKIKETRINGKIRKYLFFELRNQFVSFGFNKSDKEKCKLRMRQPNRTKKTLNSKSSQNKKTQFQPIQQQSVQQTLESPVNENDKLCIWFEFGKTEKELTFPNDSLLIEAEKIIKKVFKIDKKEELMFFWMKEDGDVELIEKNKTNLESLKNRVIKIYLQKQLEKEKAKYYYQIEDDETVYSMKLNQNATVKTMKSKISKLKNGINSSKIKIYLDNVELEDETFLDFLKLKNGKFFVKIDKEENLSKHEEVMKKSNENTVIAIEEEEEDI